MFFCENLFNYWFEGRENNICDMIVGFVIFIIVFGSLGYWIEGKIVMGWFYLNSFCKVKKKVKMYCIVLDILIRCVKYVC